MYLHKTEIRWNYFFIENKPILYLRKDNLISILSKRCDDIVQNDRIRF